MVKCKAVWLAGWLRMVQCKAVWLVGLLGMVKCQAVWLVGWLGMVKCQAIWLVLGNSPCWNVSQCDWIDDWAWWCRVVPSIIFKCLCDGLVYFNLYLLERMSVMIPYHVSYQAYRRYFSRKVLNPKLELNREKTMLIMVVTGLKFNSKCKIFHETVILGSGCEIT